MLLCCVGYLKRISKMKNKKQHIFPFLERLLDGAEVEWKKLGEVSTQISGMSGVSNKWASKGNCRFVDYLNAYKHIKIDINQLPFATVKKLNQTELRQGDILFTSASETPDECAISSVIEDKIIAGVFLDDHLFGIRINEEYKEIIDSSFLNYFFRSPDFRKIVNKAVRGVTRFYISKVAFMRLSIPIPPLSVQKRIVEILDKFTTLEAELEAELDCRKRQYEYYRNQLLSFDMLNNGEKRLNNVNIKSLEEIVEIKRGRRLVRKELSRTGRYAVFQNSMTPLGYFDSSNVDGDSTFIISAGAAGEIGYSSVDFWAADDIYYFIPSAMVCSKYLYYFLLTRQSAIKGQVRRASVPRLAKSAFAKIQIPIPSLAQQQRIVSILDKFDTLVNSISEGLPKEIELRRKQYEYYRNQLLSFPEHKVSA